MNSSIHFFSDQISLLFDKLAGKPVLYHSVILFLIVVSCILIHFLTSLFISLLTKKIKKKFSFPDESFQNKLVRNNFFLSLILPLFLFSVFCKLCLPTSLFATFIARCGLVVVVICLNTALILICSFISDWIKATPGKENTPIHALMQSCKIFFVFVAGIQIISIIVWQRPIYVFSGIGAAMAVFLLVFQNSLLSFVAGIQINTSRLVKIGDWIAFPDGSVDGLVVEITQHILKVRGWDMTIAALPIRKLTEEVFINYTNVFQSGHRLIKRQIMLDQDSIHFLTPDELVFFRKFDIFRDMLEKTSDWSWKYFSAQSAALSAESSCSAFTNADLFMRYMDHCLKTHPDICRDPYIMVHTLDATEKGYPVEFVAYSKKTKYVPFNQVLSEIVNHLIAVLPMFHLKAFQLSSDNSVRSLSRK